MKYLFCICFVLLLGTSQMTRGQQYEAYQDYVSMVWRNGIEYVSNKTPVGFHTLPLRRPDYKTPGFISGRVMGNEGEGVPYARISFIIGKDTTTLTCDAIGTYIWETNRARRGMKVRVVAEGFEIFEKPYLWIDINLVSLIRLQRKKSIKKWNKVIVSRDGVQIKIGDKILDYGGPAFSNFEGDWVGNLLRKLPGLFVSTENNRLTVNGEPIYGIDIVHWQNFEHGAKFILDNIERKKELRKNEKKKRKGN